ncbi:hypothetical protein [Alteribacillus bidgolensis]|uniref:Uncharacterized protein n=1 Tax=Alteribacillus bidgolensis TaxID=930129 RepID=A0A1G8Q6C4_9BACI|nr:hypothetical protein [Alteribacillus bidgolensis]SDJ00178.1 hypothetical protein SAMN05216352_11813 [Alteribacillus bidgolensis]
MAIFDEKKKKRLLGKKGSNGTSVFVESDTNNTTPKEKPMKQKVQSSFADIAPVIDITGNGYLQLSINDGYMDIVQLTSMDIYSLNQNDKDKMIFSFAFFLQWYQHDLKIIPFDFPVDTSRQQRFVLEKMDRTTNEKYRMFLEQKLRELQFIEKERSNREFYMFIYAEDEFTLRSRISDITGQMSTVCPIIKLTDEKKINILYKLHNLNSKNRSIRGES